MYKLQINQFALKELLHYYYYYYYFHYSAKNGNVLHSTIDLKNIRTFGQITISIIFLQPGPQCKIVLTLIKQLTAPEISSFCHGQH